LLLRIAFQRQQFLFQLGHARAVQASLEAFDDLLGEGLSTLRIGELHDQAIATARALDERVRMDTGQRVQLRQFLEPPEIGGWGLTGPTVRLVAGLTVDIEDGEGHRDAIRELGAPSL
jgi:hypothetical protein